MLVCGNERMDEWYVRNEIRSEGNAGVVLAFVHHGKERRRVKAPFQTSYSQSPPVDMYLSALHRAIAKKI